MEQISVSNLQKVAKVLGICSKHEYHLAGGAAPARQDEPIQDADEKRTLMGGEINRYPKPFAFDMPNANKLTTVTHIHSASFSEPLLQHYTRSIVRQRRISIARVFSEPLLQHYTRSI